MFTGQKHRANSDSRGQDVREYHLHPGFWDGSFGRGRGGNRSRRWGLLRRVTRWLFFGARRKQLLHAAHVEHASGLPAGRDHHSQHDHGQRTNPSLASTVSFLILACGLACSRHSGPQVVFDHAYKAFLQGNLKQSQEEAHAECERFRGSNPEWAWKFRILEAESLLWQ